MTDQERAGIEIEILRHAEVMVGNCVFPEKSRIRREGINRARNVLRDLIAIRMDKLLPAPAPSADLTPEVYSCPVCHDPMQGDNGCGCKPAASGEDSKP